MSGSKLPPCIGESEGQQADRLHRQRAGFAAAVIGSVGFVGGGLVAPLTAIGEVTRTASIIFVVCGVLLVLISFWLNRRMKLIRGDELKL